MTLCVFFFERFISSVIVMFDNRSLILHFGLINLPQNHIIVDDLERLIIGQIAPQVKSCIGHRWHDETPKRPFKGKV